MTDETKFLEAVKKLRDGKKRKFDQSVDLIVNLKLFDVRRESFNVFVSVPNKVKEKKIAGFLEKKSEFIDTITNDDLGKYKDKNEAKKLISKYDFFIANAKLMPAVATSLGRVLGPADKMPSPKLGILISEEEKAIKALLNKINSTIRVKVKEASIKFSVGKESLKDEQIVQNLVAAYHKVLESLPKKKENIKNISIKLSMGKPIKVKL